MSSEPKKISFGFTKVHKKQEISKPKPKDVELIDCIESRSIKVVGNDITKAEAGPLIIPLKRIDKSNNGTLSNLISIIKEETNGVTDDTTVIKKEINDDKNVLKSKQSLEILAANEIINDLKKSETLETKVFNVPLPKESLLSGENESTLDDYENIPIADFGMAMLRGMGWEQGKGIGKNEKQIALALPELRPKGLGLGADRPTSKVNSDRNKSNSKEEDLQIKKGAYVKIVMGKQANTYGQIEGLDDDSGRLFVKMALGGNKVSLNEFMVEPVTKAEYDKNGRVLNSQKYEEYKNKEGIESKIFNKSESDSRLEIVTSNKKLENNDGVQESNNSKLNIKDEVYKKTNYNSDEDNRHKKRTENIHKKNDKYSSHDLKEHKSKRSHKKKSKRNSSEDSSSSDLDRHKQRYRSPDRSRSTHRSERKDYSRSKYRRSRSREKKCKDKKSRHRSRS